MPVQQDGARDGLQVARGRAEKLASSRWPQPVAKTRSRCDIQQRDRGHRQADRPSARNRRRLTGSGRHQNLAIAPEQLAAAESSKKVVSIHPATIKNYLADVATMRQALDDEEAAERPEL